MTTARRASYFLLFGVSAKSKKQIFLCVLCVFAVSFFVSLPRQRAVDPQQFIGQFDHICNQVVVNIGFNLGRLAN